MNPGGILKGVLDSPTGELPALLNQEWLPPSPTELNRSIDVFEIVRLIGRGGMGAVYQARQSNLGRDVAIKILPRELSQSPLFAKRFRREARSLAALNHGGIVAIYNFGQTVDGILYLVMEYVEGQHLGTLNQTGKLSPAEKFDLILEVCDGLKHAHEHGFVHRDLKPANILVTSEGQTKLVDFGLAKLIKGSSEDLDATRRAAEDADDDGREPDPHQDHDTGDSAVIADISYEIRTPLNAIIGYSEMLGEDAEDLGHETLAADLRRIREAGELAMELINQKLREMKIGPDDARAFLDQSMQPDEGPLGATLSGAILGTCDYMAPEQFEKNLPIDQRTDIYALGVILYELLTGARPRGNWKRACTLVPTLPPEIDEVIGKALEPEASDRYDSISDFHSDLSEARRSL